jgi:hypothetical protein
MSGKPGLPDSHERFLEELYTELKLLAIAQYFADAFKDRINKAKEHGYLDSIPGEIKCFDIVCQLTVIFNKSFDLLMRDPLLENLSNLLVVPTMKWIPQCILIYFHNHTSLLRVWLDMRPTDLSTLLLMIPAKIPKSLPEDNTLISGKWFAHLIILSMNIANTP